MAVLIIFFLGMLLTGEVSAAIYKCTGVDGKIEFSDKPCAGDSEPIALQYNILEGSKDGASPAQAVAGQVTVGMTAAQVRQAWGEPDSVKVSKKKNAAKEEWNYRRDGKKVTLVDGEVTAVASQAVAGTAKTAASSAVSTAKTSAATKRAEKAGERRFVREGMTAAEVRARIGGPDSQEAGACRERTTVNAKKQIKTVRDLCEKCWIYDPAAGDLQTQTQVCFQNGQVSSVKRNVVR